MRAQKQRQRVSTACKACRIKRTKCDGHPQQCSACRYRNQPCEYVYTEDRRKPPSKQHVQALEARIHTLERQLAAACARACADDSGSPHAASRVPMAPIRATDIDDVTDTLGSFNIGDGGEICYFGSRSNFNLLRSARLVDRPSSLEMQRRGREATRQQIGLAPVSDELEAHLLGLFWTWQNAWQRVVARAPFLRDRAARSGAPCGRFYSPALLASMLALASRYSDRPEVRADPLDARTAGDTFAAQAKIMLLYECETPTTTTVQAIALLSLRETALDKEGLGWMYCGMAVRMALNLGLHLDCSRCVDEGLLTAEQVEVRSVTWWGCYVLDKLFNIGLGRPSMILDCLMTVEMPSTCCEEEQQPWTSSSADPTDASAPVSHCVSNAIHTCKLLISVVEILDNIYSPGKPDKTSMVSDAHLRLTSFYNALPAVLRISKSYKDRALPHVYQLHLQYHVIMVLLHRPFIKSQRTSSGTITGGLSKIDSHSTACRTSAEWIATIFRNYKMHYTLRLVPISAVHCAFTAAVIFLLDATSDNEQARKRAMHGFKVCFDSLKDMEIAWNWSTRAVLALQNIAQGWNVEIPGDMAAADASADKEAPVSSMPLQDHHAGCSSQTLDQPLPASSGGTLPEEDELLFGQFMEPLTDMPHDSLASALDWSMLDPFAETQDLSGIFDN